MTAQAGHVLDTEHHVVFQWLESLLILRFGTGLNLSFEPMFFLGLADNRRQIVASILGVLLVVVSVCTTVVYR